MRLKLEFKYQCEVEFKEEEIDDIKKSLKKDIVTPWFTENVNKFFLLNDGRTEAGGIVDFDYKLED